MGYGHRQRVGTPAIVEPEIITEVKVEEPVVEEVKVEEPVVVEPVEPITEPPELTVEEAPV
jgi:hypothetical protein